MWTLKYWIQARPVKDVPISAPRKISKLYLATVAQISRVVYHFPSEWLTEMGSAVIDRVEWRRRDDNGGIIIWRQMASSVPLLLLLLLHTHPDPSSWKISLLLQWFSFIQVNFTKLKIFHTNSLEPWTLLLWHVSKEPPNRQLKWICPIALQHIWVLNPWHRH